MGLGGNLKMRVRSTHGRQGSCARHVLGAWNQGAATELCFAPCRNPPPLPSLPPTATRTPALTPARPTPATHTRPRTQSLAVCPCATWAAPAAPSVSAGSAGGGLPLRAAGDGFQRNLHVGAPYGGVLRGLSSPPPRAPCPHAPVRLPLPIHWATRYVTTPTPTNSLGLGT